MKHRPEETPKDVYSSGNADCQCYAILYGATYDEANEKRKAYLRQYDPRGYATHTTDECWITVNGKPHYRINMSRWHSCD